jgi:signal transduction histidine kinase
MLGVVLVGFSVTLYGLARTYLYRQLDERLAAAIDTLAAAVEGDAAGVQWEPREHFLNLGFDSAADQVRWLVHGPHDELVDQSANLSEVDASALPLPDLTGEAPGRNHITWRDRSWQLIRQRLGPIPSIAAEPDPGGKRFSSLVLTALVSQAPVDATLRTLAIVLSCLSSVLWLVAAGLGRWLCRRALVPVTRMAEAARGMRAADLDQRLPSPGTGDELEDLGQAFNDLVARVQETFERQRRFTGDASHQLRTPLTAMLGQIEVALRRERSVDDYRKVLSLVHAQTERLHRIVEMLLFLARADKEAWLADLDALDLARWLPAHAQSWAEHPRAADLRVECAAHECVSIRAQEALLGQLLDNLVDNAFKYSEAGSPVFLRLTKENGQALLSVEDRGCGIAMADLGHVCEPFFRTAEVRRRGKTGVGLGLAVSRRIAAAFGGQLDVASAPGCGSRFTVRCPLVINGAARSPAEGSASGCATATTDS